MFKIVSEPQFTHTVPVLVPVDGGHREETLRARFRVLSGPALAELQADPSKGVSPLLRASIVSLDDLVDEDGKPVPYSDALRDQLLGLPYVRDALFRAFSAALTKARAGN